VHAIGWVLTTNAFTMTPAEAREVTDLWTELVRRRAEDLRQAPLLLHVLFPRSLSLSPATRAALATLTERMAAQHPERFGAKALRQRRNHWAGQALLGFLLSGLAAILVPTSWPQAAMVAPTFFLMGCGCVLPTVTLWRAAAAVQKCHTQGRVAGPLVRRAVSPSDTLTGGLPAQLRHSRPGEDSRMGCDPPVNSANCGTPHSRCVSENVHR
jgi:hypothetical protein